QTSTTLKILNDDCVGTGISEVCFGEYDPGTVVLPATINTDTSSLCSPNAAWYNAFIATCFVVANQITATSTRIQGSRALAVVAVDSLTITGTLDASSNLTTGRGPASPS